MPYSTVGELPSGVQKLPAHGQAIYMKAFNAAFKQYDGDEAKAHATAWSVIKTQYEQDADGNWTAKEVKEASMTTLSIDNDPAMESLRGKYRDVLAEVQVRDISVELQQAVNAAVNTTLRLFEAEQPSEAEVIHASGALGKLVISFQEKPFVKKESGHSYPIQAYAYAPNKFRPESWQLRTWEDPDKGVTKKQLSAAAASLSPGGNNGIRAKVAKDALPAVKRQLRAAYRKLGLEANIPKWIIEAETRERLTSYIPLTEAKLDQGRATVVVIKAGFNTSEDRYYPPEVLQRDYGIFEGAKMYADHPTPAEEQERPERSIRDWVATLSSVTCDENGTITGVAEVIEGWLQQKLASLAEKGMLSEMGISIDAVGSASKGSIEGRETLVIERLVTARSVDFVTQPGAGGIVTFYEADRQHDVDLVELAALKDKRPDLVEAIEAEIRRELRIEEGTRMDYEQEIKTRDEQITTLTTERDGLKDKMAEAEKVALIAETKATIDKAVGEADLPEPSKARLVAQFADATTADGLKEAIKAEISYVAEIKESGKVKGLGPTGGNEPNEGALRASLKLLNPQWSDTQLDVAVRG